MQARRKPSGQTIKSGPIPPPVEDNMSDTIKHISDTSFEADVLKSDKPVLVDFWAEWCMPCRMLAPTIDELAKEFNGKVKIGKVDVDSNRDTA